MTKITFISVHSTQFERLSVRVKLPLNTNISHK